MKYPEEDVNNENDEISLRKMYPDKNDLSVYKTILTCPQILINKRVSIRWEMLEIAS